MHRWNESIYLMTRNQAYTSRLISSVSTRKKNLTWTRHVPKVFFFGSPLIGFARFHLIELRLSSTALSLSRRSQIFSPVFLSKGQRFSFSKKHLWILNHSSLFFKMKKKNNGNSCVFFQLIPLNQVMCFSYSYLGETGVFII